MNNEEKIEEFKKEELSVFFEILYNLNNNNLEYVRTFVEDSIFNFSKDMDKLEYMEFIEKHFGFNTDEDGEFEEMQTKAIMDKVDEYEFKGEQEEEHQAEKDCINEIQNIAISEYEEKQ